MPTYPWLYEGCHLRLGSLSLGILFPQPSLQAALEQRRLSGHTRASQPHPTSMVPRSCSPMVLLCWLCTAHSGLKAAAFPVPGSHQRPGSRLQVGAAERCFWNDRVSNAFEEVVPLMELLFQVCMGQRW